MTVLDTSEAQIAYLQGAMNMSSSLGLHTGPLLHDTIAGTNIESSLAQDLFWHAWTSSASLLSFLGKARILGLSDITLPRVSFESTDRHEARQFLTRKIQITEVLERIAEMGKVQLSSSDTTTLLFELDLFQQDIRKGLNEHHTFELRTLCMQAQLLVYHRNVLPLCAPVGDLHLWSAKVPSDDASELAKEIIRILWQRDGPHAFSEHKFSRRASSMSTRTSVTGTSAIDQDEIEPIARNASVNWSTGIDANMCPVVKCETIR